jgi:hypothetical protein
MAKSTWQTPAGAGANNAATAAEFPAKKQGTGLSYGSTRGMLPPTFAIASPSSSEGEAMAKAGGKETVF